MTESDDQPSSGNRWEPAGEPAPDAGEIHEAEAAPVAAGTAAAAPPSRPAWLTRARAGIAGGAVAALLAGGLGGFAIGRATAGTDGGPGPRAGPPTRGARGRGRAYRPGAAGAGAAPRGALAAGRWPASPRTAVRSRTCGGRTMGSRTTRQ